MAKKIGWKRRFFTFERFVLIVVAVFAVSLLSFVSMALINEIEMGKYVEADVIRVIDNTVVIGSNCTAIVAETSAERAKSIEMGLSGELETRPNTHDLFRDVLENYNITMEMMTMDDFDGETYYSTMHFKKGDRKMQLDAKPSDALAMALRMESPVYIKKGILSEIGKNICK